MASTFDWAAVARYVAGHLDAALVILDASGRVSVMTAAAEAQLGWSRASIEGRSWCGNLAADVADTYEAGHLEAVLSGQRRRATLTIRTQRGAKRSIDVDFTVLGHGPGAAVIGVLVGVRDLELPSSTWNKGDYEYRISQTPFGDVRRALHVQSGESLSASEGRPCYQLFHRRATPCEDCPAAKPGDLPQTVARTKGGAQPLLEILTARPSEENGAVDVSVRRIPVGVLGALVEARMRELAAAANLTKRERDVLRYLIMGRSVQDIGTALGITTRTVKFHQANIVRKSGADSRADILRLIL